MKTILSIFENTVRGNPETVRQELTARRIQARTIHPGQVLDALVVGAAHAVVPVAAEADGEHAALVATQRALLGERRRHLLVVLASRWYVPATALSGGNGVLPQNFF